MSGKKLLICLILILCLGFLLRIRFIGEGDILFTYDQARDAFAAHELLNGHLKVQGPPASMPGLFHGVIYHYLLVPVYFLGSNSLINVSYIWAFLNLIPIVLAYLLGVVITKNIRIGLVCAFLLACGINHVQYSIWLSNPTIVNWFLPITYLGLMDYFRQKKWGPVLSGFGLGLAVQGNIIMAYQFITVLWIFLYKKILSRIVPTSKFLVGIFLGLLTMIVSAVKFNFLEFSGIARLLSRDDFRISQRSGMEFFKIVENHMGNLWNANFVDLGRNLGFLVVMGLLMWGLFQKKYSELKIIVLGIVSMILAIYFGGESTPHINMGVGILFTVLVGVMMGTIIKKKIWLVLVLGIFFIHNLENNEVTNVNGPTFFSLQKDMLIKNQMKVVEYIYNDAAGQDFSINSLTVPLYVNSVWDYLFRNYALTNDLKKPYWHGRDQVGQPGNGLIRNEELVMNRYLIIEPLNNVPVSFVTDYKNWERRYGDKFEVVNFGDIQIEARRVEK